MKVYRTESRYYFSSKQLLPVGSLVFFSHKIRRYVHPTDGTLLDADPRLQLLSEAESQEFEAHWQDTLPRVYPGTRGLRHTKGYAAGNSRSQASKTMPPPTTEAD